jgi:hypothetical protein
MVLLRELDRQLHFAYPTKTTQYMYLLPLALSCSRHENMFELCYLLWSVHKLTSSWDALEAEDSLILSKVYEHFSYRPQTIVRDV